MPIVSIVMPANPADDYAAAFKNLPPGKQAIDRDRWRGMLLVSLPARKPFPSGSERSFSGAPWKMMTVECFKLLKIPTSGWPRGSDDDAPHR